MLSTLACVLVHVDGMLVRLLEWYDKVRQTTQRLSDLATARAESPRSTNQSCPFGRLNTHSYQVAKWFDALCHMFT